MVTALENERELRLRLVKEWGDAVMMSTKYQGGSVARNRRERKALEKLLCEILDQPPTDQELSEATPG